jgi:hypothetical protein
MSDTFLVSNVAGGSVGGGGGTETFHFYAALHQVEFDNYSDYIERK